MKRLKFYGGGYDDYSSPSVTALEVAAEKGFALSGNDLFNDDSLKDGFGEWGTFGN